MKRLCLILMLIVSPVWALDPSEMLQDPALELRARALDYEIRCVKCQSEAVASSNAEWAKDARRTIRELIEAGASDAEVKDWFLARYGEYVLMDPPKTGSTLLLWLAGPAMLLVAVFGAGLYLRGRQGPGADVVATGSEAPLSAEEKARLEQILKQ